MTHWSSVEPDADQQLPDKCLGIGQQLVISSVSTLVVYVMEDGRSAVICCLPALRRRAITLASSILVFHRAGGGSRGSYLREKYDDYK